MSEAEERANLIDSTKTVVVAEDIHRAIRHIVAEEEIPIKTVIDRELRKSDVIQEELESLSDE